MRCGSISVGLVTIDQGLDYAPGFSTVTNIVVIVLKIMAKVCCCTRRFIMPGAFLAWAVL